MTPDLFIHSLKTFKKGDMGFCAISSISIRKDYKIDNVGFWYEVISNDVEPVLLVQMDSFTFDRPVPSSTIIGKNQINTYIENLQQWTIYELASFFSLTEPPIVSHDLMFHDHSLSA